MDGPGQPVNEARGAAEGKAGGPMITPASGPTDRRDIAIAAAVVAAVACVVLALALS